MSCLCTTCARRASFFEMHIRWCPLLFKVYWDVSPECGDCIFTVCPVNVKKNADQSCASLWGKTHYLVQNSFSSWMMVDFLTWKCCLRYFLGYNLIVLIHTIHSSLSGSLLVERCHFAAWPSLSYNSAHRQMSCNWPLEFAGIIRIPFSISDDDQSRNRCIKTDINCGTTNIVLMLRFSGFLFPNGRFLLVHMIFVDEQWLCPCSPALRTIHGYLLVTH